MSLYNKMKAKEEKSLNITRISNKIIESFVKRNNAVALKTMFYISKSDLDLGTLDSDIITLTIDEKDLLSYCNITSETLRRNLRKMVETSTLFEEVDENGRLISTEYMTILPSAKLIYGRGKIEFKMFKKVLQLIHEVQSKYTLIDTTNIMKLKSKHALRMIQLLEQIEGFSSEIAKRKTYCLEELDLMFGTKYKTVYEFERSILKPVQKELTEYSNITFEYLKDFDKVSRGRPKALGFIIDLVSFRPMKLQDERV